MDVKTLKRGRIGYLTLDKPKTLNALTESMIDDLYTGLTLFESDDSVDAIVINSSSDRAFCAGGDMKRIRELAIAGDRPAIDAFFEKEYAFNLAISRCSKPYIALINGVAMGGGLGLSVHGSHRIVTEQTLMAMPETRIGFFPDVGGSYFLPRLPLNAGRWFAMTAAPARGAETVMIGLATHMIDSTNIESLLSELEDPESGDINKVIDKHALDATRADFISKLEQRSTWFAPASVDAIRHNLEQASSSTDDAAHLLELLNGASPYSLDVTKKLLTDTQGLALSECLIHEKAASMEAAFHADFIEGVRAVLVDKDRNPKWQASN